RLEGGKELWSAYVKREVGKAEEAAKKAKADADQAEKDKAPDLKAKKEALKQAQDRVQQLKKEMADGYPALKKRAKEEDVYAKDAFKLLTNKDLCLKCHDVGAIKTDAPKGPDLLLSAERLRPEWTLRWVANPGRMFPYTPVMPQNFPNKEKRL